MMELKNKKTKQNKQLPEACNNGRVRGLTLLLELAAMKESPDSEGIRE